MLIYFLRHGLTEYNAEKRYQGQRDIPLSAAGRAMLRKADIEPQTVYITPLCRTRQTAEVLFPTAKLVVVDGLKEMCFGSFEGRNFIEMEHVQDNWKVHRVSDSMSAESFCQVKLILNFRLA